MAEQLKDFLAATTLNGGITSGALSLVVSDPTNFPASGTFDIRIDNEIISVSAVSGATFTVTRGQGTPATTAAAHSSGAAVRLVITKRALEQAISDGAGVGSVSANWNLVRLSRFDVGTGWTASAGVTATYAQTPPTDLNAYPFGRVYGVKLVVAAAGDRYLASSASYRPALETGKTVSFGVWAKSLSCSDVCTIRAIFQKADHSFVADNTIATLAANSDWTFISGSIAVPALAAEVEIRLNMAGTGDYYFAGPRLEYGATANDFEPNPTDTAGFWT